MARLTDGIPGTGGGMKFRPEDFMVTEIPLYEASGQGTHLYLTVRKTGLTTHAAIDRIARSLGRKSRDVGYAGLKDAAAVAVQRLSIEHVDEKAVERLSVPGVEIIDVQRHHNKLKPGHLAGNRFRIVIRGARHGSAADAQKSMDVLAVRGVPNHFGEQRFGGYQSGHLAGRALVNDDADAFLRVLMLPAGWRDFEPDAGAARTAFSEGRFDDALRTLPVFLHDERLLLAEFVRSGNARSAMLSVRQRMRRFYMNAWQSHLFNEVLRRRGVDGIDTIAEGDLAYIHSKGAVFLVDDPAAEAERVRTAEISPSGPMFGRKTILARGAPGDVERAVMRDEGISADTFRSRHLKALVGERRPLRVPMRDVQPVSEPEAGVILLEFSLPPGSYATNVVREVTKTSVSSDCC